MYLDGEWSEVRDPTDEEVKNINGVPETRHRGVRGIHLCGVLAKIPKYLAFLLDEGKKGHPDMKKFAEWVIQNEVSAIVDKGR